MVRRTIRKTRSYPQRTLRKRQRTLRKRMTSVGRLMAPVDIRSKQSIGELMKRIRKGPITIVLIYADWCGHCTDFKPHFDEASKSPSRTVQVAAINETMINPVNKELARLNHSHNSIAVEGYPTVLLLDQNAREVTRVNPVQNTSTMEKVMNKSGNLAASLKSVPLNSLALLRPTTANTLVSSVLTNSENKNIHASKGSRISQEIRNSVSRNEEAALSLPPIETESENAEEASLSLMSPPEVEKQLDAIRSANSLEVPTNSRNTKPMTGGSLFSTLGHTAYKLAPIGVLLGAAALTLKKRKSTRRSSRKNYSKNYSKNYRRRR